MKTFGTMKILNNELMIGGVSVSALKAQYQTPLYVYDQEAIERKIATFKDHFKHEGIKTQIAYASKAFLCIAMAQMIQKEGLSIDVASGGELYTVYKAGFDMTKVIFHGNNKQDEELQQAIDWGCGLIVIDNRHEMKRLDQMLKRNQSSMNVLLRINPGIDASTHEYIKTTTHDSKFGESIYDEAIYDMIHFMNESESLNLKGFHTHIGSQIFDATSFFKASDVVLDFYKDVEDRFNIQLEKINLGGGFGVYYTEGDEPFALQTFLKAYIDHVVEGKKKRHLHFDEVIIEPGRSLVCNAGSTLYTVGDTKSTFGKKDYIYIDGGMSDNPRPALYQAQYEAALANRMNDDVTFEQCVAGKLCESGDVIIQSIKLPQAHKGDLLIVPSTGAYTFSMSSNYNRMLRPAVVFVKDGKHQCVVKRQTLDDLIQGDLTL